MRSTLHQWGLNEGRHPTTGVAFDAVHAVRNHHYQQEETTMDDQDQLDAGTIPPPNDDTPATAPAPPETQEPTGRLRIPDDTKGFYVVLWARKPARGDDTRPRYVEAACVKASGPDAAKRIILGHNVDPVDQGLAEFLRRSAAQKPGILLRAVPAMHWPGDVTPTTYDRPAPVLQIG